MRNFWRDRFRGLVVAATAIALNAFAQDTDLAQRRELAAKVVQANMQAVDPKKLAASATESIQFGVVNGLKRTHPNLSAEYLDKVASVVAREATPTLAQAMAELFPPMLASLADTYAQKFTLLELAELVKVYENPVVRRATNIALESTPQLMEPLMQSMQQRTQSVGPRIIQALTRDGLLPPPKP